MAREAGALIASAAARGRPSEVSEKGRNNLVTETDHASEALILERLAEAFPEHAVLSEESRPDIDSSRGWVWVVDPLDGTRNFTAGIPLYCVNVALALDGEVLLGATYDPNRDVCFLGGPGLGLTANGEPVRASTRAGLESAIVTLDLGYNDARALRQLELAQRLWLEVGGIRMIASAALGLAWAAAGLTDVFAHSSLAPWDVAAALALVPAGGGLIVARDGTAASLAEESAVAGAPGAVRAFLEHARAVPRE